MPRIPRKIRPGVIAGFVPDYPTFTFEEASVICRKPGCEPDYLAAWRMVKHGVRVGKKTVKLIAERAVGGRVISAQALRDFLRELNPIQPSIKSVLGHLQDQQVSVRRGEIGTYQVSGSRQKLLQLAVSKLAETPEHVSPHKAEGSGRTRPVAGRVEHGGRGKGRTGEIVTGRGKGRREPAGNR